MREYRLIFVLEYAPVGREDSAEIHALNIG